MPDFPRSYLRQTIKFTLPGGEVASTSCAWDSGDTLVSLDAGIVGILSGRADDLWDDIKGQYAGNTNYVGNSIAWIAIDGHTVETADNAVAPRTGFGTSNGLPHEVAIVASLKSATNNRRGRGRMYFPATQVSTCDGNSRLGSGARDALADGMAAYLADITSGADTFVPVIASKTAGALYPVVQVSVGDVFDAQRRRRDSLTEVRSVRSL